MQALRKTSTELPAAYPADPSSVLEEQARPELANGHAAMLSPALALREHLSARLEDMAQVGIGNAVVLADPTVKLPMQARLAVILGLSATLWFGLYMAIAAVL